MPNPSDLSTASLIRDHINNHPVNEILTTRDLVHYGTRRAVDNAIAWCLKMKLLKRVARGCFIKPQRNQPVTELEIAEKKATSFGRKIISYAADVARELGILSRPSTGTIFAINGRSSSFMFNGNRIAFKGTSPRKFALGDSTTGRIIRALCHLGEKAVNARIIGLATRDLTAAKKIEIAKRCSSMPAWLADYFYSWNLLEFVETKMQVNEQPAPYMVSNVHKIIFRRSVLPDSSSLPQTPDSVRVPSYTLLRPAESHRSSDKQLRDYYEEVDYRASIGSLSGSARSP